MTEYYQQYYETNKQTVIDNVRRRQKERKQQVQELKLQLGCKLCGYKKSAKALQFHHTNKNKEHNISRMAAQGRALKSILEEIEKCICVCSNCHAELHDE